jgi:hypothetical protein
MENKEKQITEEPKDPGQVGSLSEADLDNIAGGGADKPINGAGVGLGKKTSNPGNN